MLPSWLRPLFAPRRTSPVRRPRRAAAERVRPRLVECEDRTLPATVTWIGTANGNWHDPTKWSTGQVPQLGDDVVIPDVGPAGSTATITVAAAAGNVSVNSINSLENLTISNGALTVATATNVRGTLTITGPGGGVGSFTANGPVIVTKSGTSGGTLIISPGGRVAGGAAAAVTAAGLLNIQGGELTTPAGVAANQLQMNPATVLAAGSLNLTVSSSSNGQITVNGNAAFPALTLNGATLQVAGSITTAATITLSNGGAIRSTTIPSTVTVNLNDGVFDGVTLAAGNTVRVDGLNETLTIRNGLVLHGTIDVQSAGTTATTSGFPELIFQGTQTVSGTGLILAGTNTVIGLTNATSAYLSFSSGSVVTLGAGVTLRGGRAFIPPTDATLINQGRIEKTVATGIAGAPGMALTGLGSFQNAAGGIVRMAAAGDTMTVGGTSFVNDGSIVAAAGSLTLSGTATTLGTLTNTGGTTTFAGTLNNAGRTLALDDTTGSLTLSGTIVGGRVTTAGAARLICASGAALDGVTVAGTVQGTFDVRNGLTLDGGTIASGTVMFEAPALPSSAQLLGGTGTVSASLSQSVVPGNEQTVTVGPGITVRSGTIGGGSTGQKWVHQGRISADAATVTILRSEFTNTGTMEVLNGGTLAVTVGAGWNNVAGITINPAPSTNLNSRLRLLGDIALAAVGPVTRSGGVYEIGGTLLNAGLTFAVDDTTGPYLLSGTIQGGTVTTAGAATLATTGIATLDGVTLAGTVTGNVRVRNGLVLNNGTITGGTTFVTPDTTHVTQTVTGTGTIGGTVAQAAFSNTYHTVEVGTSVTVKGGFTGNRIGLEATRYVLRGTLLVQAGTAAAASNGEFTNLGTIIVENGATLTMGGAWVNQGTIQVNPTTVNAATTLVLGGTFATAGIGTIARNGGQVFIDGTLTNTGTTFAAVGPFNGVTLRNGTIVGGRVEALIPGAFAIGGGTATLDGVTFAGLANFSETLHITNGLTLDAATITRTGNAALVFGPPTTGTTQSVAGTGTFAGSGIQSLAVSFVRPGLDLTAVFGPQVELAGGAIAFTASGASRWRLEGTVRSTSGHVSFTGGTVTNVGLIEVGTGRTLTMAGTPWINQGVFRIDGGALVLGGTFNGADVGTIQRLNGGTVSINGTASGTLTLNHVTLGGDVSLTGATFLNATIAAAAGNTARLVNSASATVLDNATLNAPITIGGSGGFTVQNGLTLNTAQMVGSADGTYATLVTCTGTQTIRTTAAGEFVFGPAAGNRITPAQNGHVLTIGPGVAVRNQTTGGLAGNGTIGSSTGTHVGKVINQGTIRADVGTLTLRLGLGGQNQGTIEARGGGTVAVAPTVTYTMVDSGTLRAADGGTVTVARGWSGTGYVIATNGGVIAFSAFIGPTTVGTIGGDPTGQLRLEQLAEYTGDLTLSSAGPTWVLNRGIIRDGTVSAPDGGVLLVNQSAGQIDGTLDNVVLDADVNVGAATLSLVNSPTVNRTIDVAGGSLRFGPATITVTEVCNGTGTIRGSGTITVNASSNSLTLGSGLTVEGSFSFISFATLTNQGTLTTGAGGAMVIDPVTFNNTGTVRVGSGGQVSVQAMNVTNFSNRTVANGVDYYTLSGGTWDVGPNGTLVFFYKQGSNAAEAFRIRDLDAALTLDAGSNVLAGFTSTVRADALGDLRSVTAAGSLVLRGGRALPLKNSLTNAGAIDIGPGSPVPARPGLVSHWSFDGNFLADSVDWNHLTPVSFGSGPPPTGGFSGTAAQFGSGLRYLVAQDSTTLRLPRFTISAYVRRDGTSGSNGSLVAKSNSGSAPTQGYGLRLTFDRPSLWINGFGTAATAPTALPAGSWSWLVGTYDGTALRLYVNGALAATTATTAAVIQGGTDLSIGGSVVFPGAIDEVKLYDRALTPVELTGTVPLPLDYTQTAGQTIIRGGSLLSTPLANTVTISGGTFTGAGVVNAHLVNTAGTVAPGNSPGFLDVAGDYTQGPGGTLALEIGGRNANVPEFDRLRVTGTATLAGTLRLSLINGFTAAAGDEFRVLTSAQRFGTFATHDFPAPGGPAKRFDPAYDGTGLTVLTQKVPPLEFGFLTSQTYAPSPDPLNPDSFVYPFDVATDAAGNSYVAGTFRGTVDFDGPGPAAATTSADPVRWSGFVAQYTPTGSLAWVRFLNPAGVGLVELNAIAVQGTDLVVVGENTASMVVTDGVNTIGGPVLASGGGSAYVVKFSTSGAFAWAHSVGGSPASAADVAIGPSGNVYATGRFAGTGDFDPTAGTSNLTSAGGSTDAFVVGLTAAGNFVAAGRLGGASNNDIGRSIAAGTQAGVERVWVTGRLEGSSVDAGSTLAALDPPPGATGGSFVLGLTPGAGSYATNVAQVYPVAAREIAVVPNGGAVVAGTFQFGVDFDLAADRAFSLQSSGGADAFALKLDAAGGFTWARVIGGYEEEFVDGLAVDAGGNVYLGGTFEDRVDFDPLDGTYTLDAEGTGQFAVDSFLVRLDAQGRFNWAAKPQGPPTVTGFSFLALAVGADGRVVSTGEFQNVVDFDPTEAVQDFGAAGQFAGYLWMLRQKSVPAATIVGRPAAAVPAGTTVNLSATVADPDSLHHRYAWTIAAAGGPAFASSSSAMSQVLNAPGIYTVTLTVTDESGNTDVETGTIVVRNATPALSTLALDQAAILENGTAVLSGTISDPGTASAHTVIVDWADGSALTVIALPAGVMTFSAAHQYPDDNPSGTAFDLKSIKVRVLDEAIDLVAAVPAQNRLVRFDGTTTYALGAFTAAGAGGLASPSAVAVGPTGDLFVSGGALGANPVIRYSGATGALVGTFVAAGAQGTTSASDLAFDPDGHLYYADAGGNRVLRFDGTTGTYLGVAASGGGLSSPRGLAFGDDGLLYVASFGSDSILRFDGATGAFVSAFVPAGTGGLDGPADLTFGTDGDLYVLSALGAPAVLRFDGTTGAAAGTFAPVALGGSAGSLLVGPGDLLTVSEPGALRRYDLLTGTLLQTVAAAGTGAVAGLPPAAEGAASVTIQNVAPAVTVRATTPAAGAPAGAQALAATVSDVGPLDTHTYAWTVTGATVFGPSNTPSFTFVPTAASVAVTLTVTDDDTGVRTTKTQVVIATAAGDTVTVTNTAAVVNGTTTPFAAGVNRVVVLGLAGDDSIDASAATLPVELVGGAGNDTLTGGSADDFLVGNNPGDYALGYSGDVGADSLAGGDGNDTLDGGLGNDTMTGGTGNDTYVQVPGSADELVEGGDGYGIDSIDFSKAFRGVTLSIALDNGQLQTVDALGHTVAVTGTFENLLGSAFGDVLTGNVEANKLDGGAGDDQLFSNDPLASSTGSADGADTFLGGAGADTVVGGAGNDGIWGDSDLGPAVGDGNDSLIGGGGADSISGGAGNDGIWGDSNLGPTAADGNDQLIGGAGADTIHGGAGNDGMWGDSNLGPTAADGNDSLIGGGGADSIHGGAGNDGIWGDSNLGPAANDGNDSLVGGAGADTINGGAGNDGMWGDSDLGPAANDGNDLLVGEGGADSIHGGAGNDGIWGDSNLGPTAADGDDSLVGGAGADTITGGAGNDGMWGDSDLGPSLVDGPNLLIGNGGADSIHGGAGNDGIWGDSDLGPSVADGDNLLIGNGGADTVTGGAGNDGMWGDSNLGPAANDGNDLLNGGAGADSINGGAGNDGVFGNDGDDALTGGDGEDVFDGGTGNDRIVEARDADFTLGATTLTISGLLERFYDVEQAVLTGGDGANRLDANAFAGPVALVGGAGNDTLIGGTFADQLSGGAGNDSLQGNDGDDLLDLGTGNDAADGGAGNDTFIVFLAGAETLIDPDGIDSIDLSSSAFAVVVDLAVVGTPQVVDSAGNTLALFGSFENLRGTSYDDDLKGTAGRNILDGAGGRDRLDGRAAADTVQGSFTQVVYLDFDSATGPGEKVYSIEERNQIQARLERDFAFPFNVAFSQTAPPVGRFTAVVFNAGGTQDDDLLVGGQAYELDWRNVNAASRADVNVNAFLGRRFQPAASSGNYVALSASVAAHELGHLLGLRHYDAFGPIGVNPATGLPYGIYGSLIARSVARNEAIVGSGSSATQTYRLKAAPVLLGPAPQAGNQDATAHPAPNGLVYDGPTAVATFTVGPSGAVAVAPVGTPSRTVLGGTLDAAAGVLTLTWSAPGASSVSISYDYDPFRPGYRGPDDAAETPPHVMASPASVGSTIAHALADTYFGERELIKLAFADAGTTLQESALGAAPAPAALGGSARALGTLPALAVPNLLPAGTANAGLALRVRAVSVVGALEGVGQSDLYAVQGEAGDFLTVEVLSASLRSRVADPLDPVVTVYDAAGAPLDYYGQPATNDDGFDNQDSVLFDVRLPATGTYFIRVHAFSPTDVGGYELFAYSYAPPAVGAVRLGGAGDTLIGGPGPDILLGSTGDDRFQGVAGEDTFVGATLDDVTGNTPPTVTAALSSPNPRTNDLLTATATVDDAEGHAVTLTFRWYVGATLVRTTADSTALTDTLDLSQPGFGDRGQTIRVEIEPSDGTDAGAVAAASATVANTPPVALNRTATTPEDTPLTRPAGADADLDALTFSLTQAPTHGDVTFFTDGTWQYTPAANYFGPDGFTFRANDGTADSAEATVVLTVGPVNDAPAAVGGSYSMAEDTWRTGPAATDVDTPLAQLSYVLTQAPAFGDVLFLADGTWQYTPAANAFGPDSFRFTVSDGDLDSNEATVAVTVAAVNDAPEAIGGSYSTAEDTPLTGPAATDVDTPLANLTYQLIQAPARGTVTFATDGTWLYEPAADSFGPDGFRFRVNDGSLDSDEAAISISVTPVNDAPVPVGGSASTAEDTVVGGPAATDVDTPLASLTYALTQPPARGNVTFLPDGTWQYVPAANAFGPDSFRFTVSDGDLDSNEATVAVTVTSVNDAPALTVPGGQTTAEDTPLALGDIVIADVDAADGTGVVRVTLAVAHGTLTFADAAGLTFVGSANGQATITIDGPLGVVNARLSGGNLTYTPNLNYHGGDTLAVDADDRGNTGVGGILAAASKTVAITVTAVNDRPTLDPLTLDTAEDTSVAGQLVAADVDSAVLTFAFIPESVVGGTVTAFDSATGAFTFAPAPDFFGPAGFRARLTDGELSAEADVVVAVAPVNDPPTARDDNYAAWKNQTLTVAAPGVLGNDTDVDGASLTVTGFTQPGHGQVSVSPAGALTYTPAAGYVGPDEFTYTVEDGAGGTVTARVAIDVRPTISVLITGGTDPVVEGSIVTLGAVVTDVAAGGAPAYSWTVHRDGVPVPLADSSAASVSFLAHDDGTYVATVTVTDGINSGEASLSVVATNATPTVAAGGNEALAGATLARGGSFADPGADVWTAEVDYGDGAGFQPLALTLGRTFALDHTYSAAGPFTVTVRVRDDEGAVGTASFQVTPQVAVPAPAVSVTAPTSGVRGQELRFQLSAQSASAAVQAAGFMYTIRWGDGSPDQIVPRSAGNGIGVSVAHTFPAHGTYTVTVTATDANGRVSAAATRTVQVAIAAVQTEPGGGRVLVVGGSTGSDAILIAPNPLDPGRLIVWVSGQNVCEWPYLGAHALPLDKVVVYAQSGHDAIALLAVNLPAEVYGQGGNDTVTAGGGDDLVWGGDGDDVLTGGSGNDVLVGGLGDDSLTGSAGRDVLIGGRGADRIVGSAGDDILVAGFTVYDDDRTALGAVMREWASDKVFAARVANLTNGSGGGAANGSVFLNAATVRDDGVEDHLTGAQGRDWFLIDVDGPVGQRDRVTDLKSDDDWLDLD